MYSSLESRTDDQLHRSYNSGTPIWLSKILCSVRYADRLGYAQKRQLVSKLLTTLYVFTVHNQRARYGKRRHGIHGSPASFLSLLRC